MTSSTAIGSYTSFAVIRREWAKKYPVNISRETPHGPDVQKSCRQPRHPSPFVTRSRSVTSTQKGDDGGQRFSRRKHCRRTASASSSSAVRTSVASMQGIRTEREFMAVLSMCKSRFISDLRVKGHDFKTLRMSANAIISGCAQSGYVLAFFGRPISTNVQIEYPM
jgi:hypothetical protein